MVPTDDARAVVRSLMAKQFQDVRLSADDPDWLGERLAEYYQQRYAGLGHDAALKTTLTGADLVMGGPPPEIKQTPRPEPAIQPLEDLLGGAEGRFTEMRNAVQDGRDVRIPTRWVWKGVTLPDAWKQWVSKDKALLPFLTWAQQLGANVLVTQPPDSSDGLPEFLNLVSQYSMRVYWEGVVVEKTLPSPVPIQVPGEVLAELPVAIRHPLDAPSVVAMPFPPAKYVPASPPFAYWLAIQAVWEYGGGTLDVQGLGKGPSGQPIAEWWFRGLEAVDPETRDWQTVVPGPGFPVVHDNTWGSAIGKVNGQYGVVLVVNAPPERKILGIPPWKVVGVTGPAYSLLEVKS